MCIVHCGFGSVVFFFILILNVDNWFALQNSKNISQRNFHGWREILALLERIVHNSCIFTLRCLLPSSMESGGRSIAFILHIYICIIYIHSDLVFKNDTGKLLSNSKLSIFIDHIKKNNELLERLQRTKL